MSDLPADVEQQLASMGEGEWSAFVARVRAPDAAEQFRTTASQHISGERLEAVCRVANLAAFTGADGQIDPAKVEGHLASMFGQQQPRHQNAGQHAEPPTPLGHANPGMNEARRRFGQREPRPVGGLKGRPGLDEAERRFGKREK
jgi:hypothetical protein